MLQAKLKCPPGTPEDPDVRRVVGDQRGFTLVELMVVVLIMGTLMGIAVPVFMGARSRGNDAVARASLGIALSAATAADFTDVDAKGMAAQESSLSFVDGDVESKGPKSLSIEAGDQAWTAATRSDTGTCFYVNSWIDSPAVFGETTGACVAAKLADGSGHVDHGPVRAGGGGGGGGGGSGASAAGPANYPELVLDTPGLAAYWRLDDTGGTAVDSGPSGLNGSYVGKVHQGDAGALSGGAGTSVGFADGYVSLPAIKLDLSNGITMAAWVRPDRGRFYDRILELSNGAPSDNVWMGRITNRNEVGYEVRPPGTPNQPVTAGKGSLVDGVWQFVVVTQDSKGRVTIYRNGTALVASGSDRLPPSIGRVENFIGRSAWKNEPTFNGNIDEVSIWTRPLGADEVSRLFKG